MKIEQERLVCWNLEDLENLGLEVVLQRALFVSWMPGAAMRGRFTHGLGGLRREVLDELTLLVEESTGRGRPV